ncbi:MerR family transcriptional regulator [Lentzea sp. NBRC 105346]|nr:MerR family transcriptional regulator [Lentzea sp. NBRC 105346]
MPTIKYYLREGLLPAGVLTSPNQAHYDESHLRRLRLVRALVDVGELSISAVRDALAAIDSSEQTMHKKLGMVQEAITTVPNTPIDERSVQEVKDFLARHGRHEDVDAEHWEISRMLTAVLSAARSLGHDRFHEQLEPYMAALEMIAKADLDYMLGRAKSVDDLVESMVVGTILGDAALIALRRMAHAVESERRAKEEDQV